MRASNGVLWRIVAAVCLWPQEAQTTEFQVFGEGLKLDENLSGICGTNSSEETGGSSEHNSSLSGTFDVTTTDDAEISGMALLENCLQIPKGRCLKITNTGILILASGSEVLCYGTLINRGKIIDCDRRVYNDKIEISGIWGLRDYLAKVNSAYTIIPYSDCTRAPLVSNVTLGPDSVHIIQNPTRLRALRIEEGAILLVWSGTKLEVATLVIDGIKLAISKRKCREKLRQRVITLPWFESVFGISHSEVTLLGKATKHLLNTYQNANNKHYAAKSGLYYNISDPPKGATLEKVTRIHAEQPGFLEAWYRQQQMSALDIDKDPPPLSTVAQSQNACSNSVVTSKNEEKEDYYFDIAFYLNKESERKPGDKIPMEPHSLTPYPETEHVIKIEEM
ncbi:MAG: hypothetical protein LBF56_00785 [Holosporales bacterium]|jgi:hypothetical protein|nr:hypothetical protein [Holosporales bacterium]